MVEFNDAWKLSAFCLLIFLFFAFVSCLDHLVHKTLYNHGLHFSYSWAVPYWRLYGNIFLIFAIVISFTYWLGSEKSERDIQISFGLFLSVCLLFWGGLPDVLWFVLWDGGLPADHIVWWWMPWFQLVGFWNRGAQLLLFQRAFLSGF